MNDVKKALACIEEAEAVLKTRPEDVHYTVRPGFEIRQQAARDCIIDLRKQVGEQTVPERVTAIFATGDEKSIEATADFLRQNNAVVVNAEGIYRAVADDIEENIGTERVFHTTQFATLYSHLRKIGGEHNLSAVDAPSYAEKHLPDVKATVAHVRDLIRGSSGDTLNTLVLRQQIVNDVITNKLTAKTILVFVTGAIPAERPALTALFSSAVVVDFPADFEPSKEAIIALKRKAQKV